jgi:hypothetical protein
MIDLKKYWRFVTLSETKRVTVIDLTPAWFEGYDSRFRKSEFPDTQTKFEWEFRKESELL